MNIRLHKPILTFCAAAAAFIAPGCSSGSGNQSSDDGTHHDIEPIDSPAYYLGRQHGQKLLYQATTTEELRSGLLDIRAREHIIRTQVSPSSADAYVEGVEQQILESGDTLATALRLK